MRYETWVLVSGGGCDMSMAVWALGLDGDYMYAVTKQASAWLPRFFLLVGVYAMLACLTD